MSKIYMDDKRTPRTEGWIIVRSYDAFIEWVKENGLPDEVSFDHDLSDIRTHTEGSREYTGYDCAKWLCEYCWENGLPIPKWNIHSANPVGKSNIEFIMKGFEKRLNH